MDYIPNLGQVYWLKDKTENNQRERRGDTDIGHL